MTWRGTDPNVTNKKGTFGTIAVKELLKSHNFSYLSSKISWYKVVGAKTFSAKTLFKEDWIKNANDIMVEVRNEFEQLIMSFSIFNEVIKNLYNRANHSKKG